jgi:hypothetical protein
MTGSNTRTSCKTLFSSIGILTLPSEYILSLMRFLSQNIEIYAFNSSVHEFNTRDKLKLLKPTVHHNTSDVCLLHKHKCFQQITKNSLLIWY